jgi:cell division septation protein DedD
MVAAAQSLAPVTTALLTAAASHLRSAFDAYIMPRSHAPAKPAKAPARMQQAAFHRGNSTAVVQLGAYGSPQRVEAAWSSTARKFGALKAYMPVSAKFDSARGTVYRLSVKGFGSADEAKNLCLSLRRSGGSCFVRSVAGDAPVQYASR